MAEDLFGSFANISSFSTAGAGGEAADSWLIKQGGMVLGPMPTSVVNNKLLSGEIKVESLAAPEGSDEFVPLMQLAAFKTKVVEAQKLAAERKAKKSRRNTILAALIVTVLLGGGSAAAYFLGLFPVDEPPPPPEPPKPAVTLADVPTLQLVALVDIEKAAENIKVKEEKVVQKSTKTAGKRKTTKGGSGGGKAADAEEEVVAGCQLPTQTIIGIVQRASGKWVSCIQHLAENEPDMVPKQLVLSFTVTTDGNLTNFQVGNRELKKHPVRNCLFKHFSAMKFPPSKGSNCTVDDWAIPLKK